MNQAWLRSAVTEAETSRRTDLVQNSRGLLELLKQVLQDEIIALSSSPFDDYDDAGWPFREADRKGQIRALKKIQTLCNQPETADAVRQGASIG